ncbi:YjbH domain-containing protein [Pseudooceanicola sediminis]|uniref:YjbH domain-containing protein n=1 Tax=Pseudooceanicola sediminis TaxID=2211117 RepID=UPI001313F628|nr:YjbH domain-containing protein [Pseudooceanicola sediminis]
MAQDGTVGAIALRPTLGFYGTPGVVDMPTAHAMPDGEMSLSSSAFNDTLRTTFTFQMAPRLSGSFRYSVLDSAGGARLRDRDFDLQYQLMPETGAWPALAVGLRGLGDDSYYSGEYLVATKTMGRLQTTGGIGWGRLGSFGGDRLGLIPQDRLDSDYFSGDAALFGAVQYQATPHLVLGLEYSSDAYDAEVAGGGFERSSPLNFAATYRFDNGIDVTAAYLYGNYAGLSLTYALNPKSPPRSPLRGAAGETAQGPAVVPRSAAALGWDSDAAAVPLNEAARRSLAAQGIRLLSFSRQGSTVRLHIRNERYQSEAQGLGRAARALTGVLPASVDTIVLIPVRHDVAASAVTLRRADLEELEHDLEGSWKSYARADIADARPYPQPAATGAARLRYSLDGYLGPTFSDPDNLLAEGGLRLDAAYRVLPGLVVSTQLRQPLVQGNGGDPDPTSSRITPVRTDATLYESDMDFEVRDLQADYFFRPGTDLYGRVTLGYLEEMYGGLSGEVLWKPVSGPLALGAEVNYVAKRDPDDLFGFADYEVATGHLSAYYDFGDGYLGQVDAGRYLAGDWGTTLSMERQFANGISIGAYVTFTDVSAEDFGSGDFDKGIRVSVPLDFLLGKPTPRDLATTVRPFNGDGGARVQISTRLYDEVRRGQAGTLQRSWGSFWK